MSYPGNPKIKLKDVADEAGVSLSTASLVLNRKGQISDDVQERVRKAAKSLHYLKVKNPVVKGQERSNHIVVLVYIDTAKAFIWDFFRRTISTLEKTLMKKSWYPIIVPIRKNNDSGDILEKVVSLKPRALFSIDYGNREIFTQLEEVGLPVVVINNSSFQNQFFTVCVDDFHGAYEGTKHVISFGHTKIAYIDYHRPDMAALVNDRFIGFKKAIDEAGLTFPQSLRKTVNLFDTDELESRLKEIFQRKNRPTALFIHDDYLAALIWVTLEKLDLRIPQDVSIIAPGDTLDYSQPLAPQITTMSIDNELMGKLAGELLIDRLEEKQQGIHALKVNQMLVDRGSCKRIT